MESFIAVCLAILTLTHLTAFVLVGIAVWQIRRTAQAMEVLTYEAREEVVRLREATERVGHLAGSLDGRWVRRLTLGASAAAFLWRRLRAGKGGGHG